MYKKTTSYIHKQVTVTILKLYWREELTTDDFLIQYYNNMTVCTLAYYIWMEYIAIPINISTAVVEDWVEIRISDSGGGIPKSVQAEIFNPFFTTKEAGKGTGQGLAIARSVVVDKHQGTLSFETKAGNGTTFVIRLPLEAETKAEEI